MSTPFLTLAITLELNDCECAASAAWPGDLRLSVGSMPTIRLLEEPLTHSVIGAFYQVYNTFGFGFLEHVYTMALERELRSRGHMVAREVQVPVYYKGEELTRQRIDMLVDQTLIVEAKATVTLHKSSTRQVYNYLCATRLQVGLLLHFGPAPAFFRLVRTRPRPHAPDGSTPDSSEAG